MANQAPSTWVDQWGGGGYGGIQEDDEEYEFNKINDKKKSGSGKKIAEVKATASAGLDKAKSAAAVGAQKVKSGTSTGFKWVKNNMSFKRNSNK